MSAAEILLEAQLSQAGVAFVREFAFAKELGRKWRADFLVDPSKAKVWGISPSILVEIDGGGFVAGRHTRGTGFEKDAEKASAAAILGYRVIRCVPRQVDDGSCLSWIRQALGVKERVA
jgi:very-short-patch-repair endonuclease